MMRCYSNILRLGLITGIFFITNQVFGQESVSFGEFKIDDKVFKLSWNISPINGHVNYSNAGIIINGEEGGTSFKLNVFLDQIAPINLKVRLVISNSLIKNTNIGLKRFPNDFIITTNDLESLTQKTQIDLKLELVESDVLKKSFKIPVSLLPGDNLASRISSCLSNSQKSKKLACLEALSKEDKEKAVKQIEELTKDRQKVQTEIKTFYFSPNRGLKRKLKCNCNKDKYLVKENRNIKRRNGNLEFTFTPNKRISIIISSKEWDIKREITISTHNKSSASLDSSKENGTIRKPNRLNKEVSLPQLNNLDDSNSLNHETPKLSTKRDSSSKSYLDDENNGFDGLLNHYTDKEKYFLSGGLVAIFIFILVLIFRRKSEKKSVTKIRNEENTYPNVSLGKQTGLGQENGNEESKSALRITKTKDETEPLISISEVKRIKNQELEDRIPLAILKTHKNYLPIDLTSCWENTSVETIYIHKRSIYGIDKFIRCQQYETSGHFIEDIPEIGGFLLGFIYHLGKDTFDVSVEYFVPITAESQNRYTVRFGDQAWVELDDAIKEYPGTMLIGWFHTHPGHGLFLSEADLREHKQLFTEPYQIAMEIDPLTPDFDTAFFSWTREGELNNIEQRLIPNWWSFLEIDRMTRKN